MIVYNSKHEEITVVDEPISSGGEGAVYTISSPYLYKRNYCVKIYYEKKRTEDRQRKIDFMVNNPPKSIERSGSRIAWPIEIVYLNNSFAGFIMPLAFPDSRKLTILTGLSLSKRLDQSWHKYDRKLGKYSLVARMKLINNISIPIFLLHDTGIYTLQDFKPDNVLITHNGMVTLCDMDSIQITNGGRLLFPGTAATLDYAPPEFSNLNVGKSTDMPVEISWDNFTIAVVFYQLLFGIHPYAVTPKNLKNGASNELATNIANNLFPFGPNAGQVEVIPPPHNNFRIIPPEMQTMFANAFSDNPLVRPDARDWGILIHSYISEAGDVQLPNIKVGEPTPEPKPEPKPKPKPAPTPKPIISESAPTNKLNPPKPKFKLWLFLLGIGLFLFGILILSSIA